MKEDNIILIYVYWLNFEKTTLIIHVFNKRILKRNIRINKFFKLIEIKRIHTYDRIKGKYRKLKKIIRYNYVNTHVLISYIKLNIVLKITSEY